MKWIEKTVGRMPAYANVGIATVLILYLTLFPDPLPDETPPLFAGADKIVHAIMFWGMATAWMFDWHRRNHVLSGRAMAIITAATIALGGGVEVAQQLMGLGRGAELADFVADCAGVTVASLSSPRLVRWLI